MTYGSSLSSCESSRAVGVFTLPCRDRYLSYSYAVQFSLGWKLHMQIIQRNTKIILLPQQRKEVNSLWTTRFLGKGSRFLKRKHKGGSVPNNPYFLDLAFITFVFFPHRESLSQEKNIYYVHIISIKKLTKTTNRIKGIGFLRFVIKYLHVDMSVCHIHYC